MATYVWTAQTILDADEVIGATDKLSFYAAAFNAAIEVGEYNDSTHVEDNGNVETCSADHIHNNKWLTSSTIDTDGGGTEDLGAAVPTDLECCLTINFAESPAVACSSISFWAYDGSTESDPPVGVDFRCGQRPDTNWTEAEGSGSALSLTDSGSATSHDFYIYISVSPTAVGVKLAFALKFQLTYQ